VRSTAGYCVHAEHGPEALASADTVVVPGYLPLEDPGERVCAALREAAARGARMVSVCTGAFALAAAGLLDHRQGPAHTRPALRRRDRHGAAALARGAPIREARRLLEATDLPVEVVAARCGLGAAANLRVHLARDAGVSPTAYRAAYQGRAAATSAAGSLQAGHGRPRFATVPVRKLAAYDRLANVYGV
jgi:transcriptional regulator GlxA family with amidase domain